MHQLTAAIGDTEADALLRPLCRFGSLLLAVSGGPDSLALLHLVNTWRSRVSAPPDIRVATVDHQLRDQSAAEAQAVAELCRTLGLVHVTLNWLDAKPARGLQDAARAARYRLLLDEVRSSGLVPSVAIVTAHHLEDQAETFVMRLARGSGVDGLAAMAAERFADDAGDVVIARPLLGVSKARLVATVRAEGLSTADDTSNADEKYERVRIRQLLDHLTGAGLTAERIATSARRLGDARQALGYAHDAFSATLATSGVHRIFERLDRRAFEKGPLFLRQRVLHSLIDRFGGETPLPRLAEVEDLATRLEAIDTGGLTLGGVYVSVTARSIEVWREAGRISDAAFVLQPGENRVWDGRFRLSLAPQAPHAFSVCALGEARHDRIARELEAVQQGPLLKIPRRAAFALPAFMSGSQVVSVPQLEYGNEDDAGSLAGCATYLASDPVN